MPTYRDEGIVLRTHKLGEADRIITVFTRVHGKVRAVARGVRRTSSKFGGRLEPFSHVDLQFAEGRSLDIITQAVQLHAWAAPLSGDYELFTAGQVLLETADKLVPVEKEPALQQYLLLAGAVRTLAGDPDGGRTPTMVLHSYLLRAQAIAGYAPVLDSCARCEVALPEASTGGDLLMWFSPMAGGLVCRLHRPPGAGRVSLPTRDLLVALLTGDWPAVAAADERTQKEAVGLVAAYTQWHLDHGLRTMGYLERSWSGPATPDESGESGD
ncbi:DNA repair protein RecO [Aestuariimicrobium sp. Y1814]|uniref:DNA repair protein RecO n=1 Tax=Aestuariimicrobium sp. Y1814 TaxID=3418742 RepID=UPI003DA708EC